MKKLLSMMMAALLVVSALFGAIADEGTNLTALDAFRALTGEQAQLGNPAKSTEQYLQEIMTGVYGAAPANSDAAAVLAAELPYLSSITSRDITAYASRNGLPVAQVRNTYYRALANVLQSEISVNPASEESRRNVQVILGLFLDQKSADAAAGTDTAGAVSAAPRTADDANREAIRRSMTPQHAATIADDYHLPQAFVEFVIMDDEWFDDDWENDDDWKGEINWGSDPYDDSFDDIALGDKDSASSTRIAELQEKLIAYGYLNSKADGRFGEKTQAALVQFQRANGLPATGVYDYDDDIQLAAADVVARWDYDDSFASSPDNSADDSIYTVANNSADNSGSATGRETSSSSGSRQNSPDNSPANSPDDSPVRSTSSSNKSSSSRQNSPDNSPQNSPDNSPQNSPANSPDNSGDDS